MSTASPKAETCLERRTSKLKSHCTNIKRNNNKVFFASSSCLIFDNKKAIKNGMCFRETSDNPGCILVFPFPQIKIQGQSSLLSEAYVGSCKAFFNNKPTELNIFITRGSAATIALTISGIPFELNKAAHEITARCSSRKVYILPS